MNNIHSQINYIISDTIFGKILLVEKDCSVIKLNFVDDVNEITKYNNKKKEISFEKKKLLFNYLDEILYFFKNSEHTLKVPLQVIGTQFQLNVWESLKSIPFGKTITYSQLADSIANPKAVRAVANACASNNIAYLIPCHRVVRKDGHYGGYRWGLNRKLKILNYEKSKCQ